TARSEALAGKKALEAKATDEAIRHFRKEAGMKPKDATGAYNLGTALSKAGNGPEALASLESARRAAKGSLASDASYNTGTTLYRSGDYAGAARAFRDALKASPGDPDASWNY